MKIAKSIMKRYDTLKLFLSEIIGIDEEKAQEEAELMKHNVSEITIKKLEDYINKMLDLNDLDCCYNEQSKKCKNCTKVTERIRRKKNIKKGKNNYD